MTNTVVLPKRKRRPVDKTLPVIMTLLLMMGLVTLFSATYYNAQDSGDALSEVKKQLFGMAVGFAAMLFTSRIPYWFWGRHRVALAGLGLSAVLLVLVIIPGVGVYINGSRRWLRLGPLSFQPSELAKYAVVLFVALALAARGKRVQRFFTGILPVLIAPGVMFLLILEQPNLSTAGTIIIVSVILVMLAGARWRHMLVLGAGGLALGAYYAWSEPYRRERLLSFTNPFAKMNDEGYQLSQSLIAFGSGGLFGMGLGCGRQKYDYLFYLCHCGGGFRADRLRGRYSAVYRFSVCGHAHCADLPGYLRLPAGGGHYLPDLRAGVYQYGRGGRRAAHHRAAPALLQRGRHIVIHHHGGGRRGAVHQPNLRAGAAQLICLAPHFSCGIA